MPNYKAFQWITLLALLANGPYQLISVLLCTSPGLAGGEGLKHRLASIVFLPQAVMGTSSSAKCSTIFWLLPWSAGLMAPSSEMVS